MDTDTTLKHGIKIRHPEFDFKSNIPQYWFCDNPVITHNFNGYNLLFPEFERFFVRSVNHFRSQIHDPKLLQQVIVFSAQESLHAQAHEDYFKVLERQGYKIDRFLRYYKRYALMIERMATPKLCIALTAAAEHYTATIAHIVFTNPELFHGMHPTMKKLIIWHSAEEVEHRSVAFDVMKTVGVNYPTRLLAFFMTSLDMLLWSTLSTLMLLHQDRISLLKSFQFKRQFSKQFSSIKRQMRQSLLAYIKADFHPDDINDLQQAHKQLKDVGINE